jgi:paraquat-inducible protein B
VEIRIFLNSPFDRFVTPTTRFWEVSGIDVSAGAGGLSMRTESLLSLLVGGIAFDTPSPDGGNHAVADNSVFPLSADRNTALSPHEAESDRYTLFFTDSLRGLSVGAPVEFLGLPVGEVSSILLDYVRGSDTLRTRVEIVTYPHRFFSHLRKPDAEEGKDLSGKERRELIQRQVAGKKLRAQLRSGSLISGQLYVALDFFPDAREAEIDWKRKPPLFPTVPGEMAALQAQMKSLLAKLDKVPLEEIGVEARQAIRNLDRTLTRVDGEIVPEAKKTMEELRRAAAAAERALANADNLLLAPDAPARQELRDALREAARAARSVRLLADYLEANPSALIRGKDRVKP